MTWALSARFTGHLSLLMLVFVLKSQQAGFGLQAVVGALERLRLQHCHLWGSSAPICTWGPRPWMSGGTHTPSLLDLERGGGAFSDTCAHTGVPVACT